MSSPPVDPQQARKARNSRSLRRATIGVGVATLGLAGGLTLAAAAATSSPKPAQAPQIEAPQVEAPQVEAPQVERTTEIQDPTFEVDEDMPIRPPATGVRNPNPGVAPVAVTGAS